MSREDSGRRARLQGIGFESLETTFFNNLVLKLQFMFEHRLSGVEGKDDNPLNEVSVLSDSVLLNDGKIQVARRR